MPRVPQAKIVRLSPVDTAGLNALGFVVAPEVMRELRDEKLELFGRHLRTGSYVTIEYVVNGKRASVGYDVIVQPPYGTVGEKTVVVIGSQDGNSLERMALKAEMEFRLRLIKRDIRYCNRSGLSPGSLVDDARKVENILYGLT